MPSKREDTYLFDVTIGLETIAHTPHHTISIFLTIISAFSETEQQPPYYYFDWGLPLRLAARKNELENCHNVPHGVDQVQHSAEEIGHLVG